MWTQFPPPLEKFSVCIPGSTYYVLTEFNTLDATRHLSDVHTYSPHTPLKWRVVKSVVAPYAT